MILSLLLPTVGLFVLYLLFTRSLKCAWHAVKTHVAAAACTVPLGGVRYLDRTSAYGPLN